MAVERKMKVLHIMPHIVFAGAELQLYSLINNSDPNIVTHEVIYYEDSDQDCLTLFEKTGVKLTRIHRSRMRPIKFLCDLSRTIRKCHADIVHCWLFSGNIWGRWAAILTGAQNILVAYRNCHLQRVKMLRLLEMLSPSKRVHYLANSQAVAESVGKILGCTAKRFHVVYNGIDLKKFDVPGGKQALKESLEMPPNCKVAVMVGRLAEQKNYPMLLNLASRCKNQELPVHFVVAGKGHKEAELRQLSEKLGVSDIVHFIGVHHDVPALLKSSDYFCFTTLFEGFPNVLLEAMASGLPVVTTDFAGVYELVEDSQNGSIVTIDDVDAAFEALKFYMDNPDVAKEHGSNAKATVAKRFSDARMVDDTMEVYKKVLNSNASVNSAECK